jgi:hypothetical protein
MKSSRWYDVGGIVALVGLVACSGASFALVPEDGGTAGDAGSHDDASNPPDAADASPPSDQTAPPQDVTVPPFDGPSPPDGAVGDSGDGGACASAMVTFVLRGGTGKNYCVGGYATACTNDWLTIQTKAGAAVKIDAPCVTDCNVCQPVACPGACAAPSPLPAAGAQRTWSGTTFTAGTCGTGISCVTGSCAPAGRYVATMCAYPRAASDAATIGPCVGSSSTPTCVDVNFEWPPANGSAVVEGTARTAPATEADAGPRSPPGTRPPAAAARRGGGPAPATSRGTSAESEGFEPSVPVRVHLISNQAPSASRTALRRAPCRRRGALSSARGVVL